jgi:hypothetical protein
MSYKVPVCAQITSEKIQEFIDEYTAEWKEAKIEQGKAHDNKDINAYWNQRVRDLEVTLRDLKLDLALKQKEENKENTLQKMKDLIHQLFELSKTL